jgi:hypothetical protein
MYILIFSVSVPGLFLGLLPNRRLESGVASPGIGIAVYRLGHNLNLL